MTAPAEATTVCPACGADVVADGGYSSWCMECGWNADPYPPAAATTRAGRRQQRDLDRIDHAFRVGDCGRPISAYVLAGVVHLLGLAVVGGAVWVAVGSGLAAFVRWPAAIVLGLVALSVAPRPTHRFGRRATIRVLDRSSAPALWGLFETVCREVGAPLPAAVVIIPDCTSDLWLVGLRRRRVLVIGLALWTMLAADERAAMLAHQLVHGRPGDARQSLILTSAVSSLRGWLRVLGRARGSAMPSVQMASAPRWAHRGAATYRVEASAGIGVFNATVAGPRYLVQRCAAAIVVAARCAGQEREHRADVAAAEAASSAAAVRWLERLYLDDVARAWLSRCGETNREPRWGELADLVASLPPRQAERIRRVGQLRRTRIDTAHAATALRVDALRTGPQFEGKVFVADRLMIDIDAELNAAP